ncbi:MAG: hypothetical protein ACMVP2_01380 [Imperialibacter sp.]|uniref:hypothetical protein n=1 Tax=Imperialibacter sp. TaxID=2038411 RepID=UPI003A89609C
MEIIHIPHDIKVFGHQVNAFPNGVGDAFDAIVERVEGGFSRPFYGLSRMKGNDVIYMAAAIEKFPEEGKQLGYEEYVIRKGNYAAITVTDWHSKLSALPGVFSELMKIEGLDPEHWAVEWYKDDDELVCMLRLKDDLPG